VARTGGIVAAVALEELSNEELTRVLDTRTSPLVALGRGVSLAARTAAIGLPFAVGFGAISALIGSVSMGLATKMLSADPATIQLLSQVGLGTGALGGLYSLLNFQKRARASRASWIPSVFVAPALLVGLSAVALQSGGPGNQMGPVVLQLVMTSADLVWSAFGGAAVCIAWLVERPSSAAFPATSLGEVMSQISGRLWDVAPVHAARDQAVTIGMQLLLPGIFYALQLAFADMVVVLDPDRAALQRSGQLTSGMRGRLFRLLFTWFLISTGFMFAVVCVDTGARSVDDAVKAISKVMFDPSVTQGVALYTAELGAAVLWWVLQLALLVLYVERENQVKAKTLLRQRS
jgi:hypothetical protein